MLIYNLMNFIIENFLIVDCGKGTVKLTTHKLLPNEKLSEKSTCTGGFCGGLYVDKQFLAFIGEKVGGSAINMIQEHYYGQLQYMVHEFCRKVKFLFTG